MISKWGWVRKIGVRGEWWLSFAGLVIALSLWVGGQVSTTAFSGGGGIPNYTSPPFTSQTTVTITHNLGSQSVIVACYDSSTPPVLIPPSAYTSLTATSANVVTVVFGSAKSGYCVVNANSGAVGATGPAGAVGPTGPTGTIAGCTNSSGDLSCASVQTGVGTTDATRDFWTAGTAPSNSTDPNGNVFDCATYFDSGNLDPNGNPQMRKICGTTVTVVDGTIGPTGLTGPTGSTGATGPAVGGTYQFSQTAAVTQTAAAENSLIGSGAGSATLPANFYSATGASLDFRASGIYSTSASPAALTIKVKHGSTILCTVTIGATTGLPSSVTNGGWELGGIVTARTVGGSGTLSINGLAKFGVSATTSLTPAVAGCDNTSTSTIDTTATQAFSITVTWGATGQSITLTNLWLGTPGGSLPVNVDIAGNSAFCPGFSSCVMAAQNAGSIAYTFANANHVYTTQFRAPESVSFSKITFYVSGGSGGTHMVVGIRATSGGDCSGGIVETGSVDTGSNGVKTTSVTATTLDPGVYCLAFASDSAATAILAQQLSSTVAILINTNNHRAGGYDGTVNFAGSPVLPSSIGSWVVGVPGVPIVILE